MKTKTLKDKNGNPIQIEQGQVRGLKEALANVGGGAGSGASGDYVPVKEWINFTDIKETVCGGIDWKNDQVLNFEFYDVDLQNKALFVDFRDFEEQFKGIQGFGSGNIWNSNFLENGCMLNINLGSSMRNTKLIFYLPYELSQMIINQAGETQDITYCISFNNVIKSEILSLTSTGLLNGYESYFEDGNALYFNANENWADTVVYIDSDNEGYVSVSAMGTYMEC